MRNHPSFDPPRQTLHLGTGIFPRLIARLGEDSEFCREIAWARDGAAVAFLVVGQRPRWIWVDLRSPADVHSRFVTQEHLPGGPIHDLVVTRESDSHSLSVCNASGTCGEAFGPVAVGPDRFLTQNS